MRTKADILSFAFLADGWLEYDPWQYVYFFDNYNDCSVGLLGGQNGWSDFLSSPTVTDSEIYSGGGNALSATDTDNTYRFAKKAIDASVDVTDNTYYLSTTFKVMQQTNDYDDSALMALAGIDNSKPKMEFRIRPHDKSIVVTGFGSYYTPVSLYNVEVGKLYRAIVKIVPIVGNTTSVKIYAGVYEIVDGQLMDESDYVWQINGFTFTLTDGQKTYPYILSGVRSEELRSDDLLLSNSWYSIQQLVSGGLGDENWPFTNIDLNQDCMIDSSDLIEMADMWID